MGLGFTKFLITFRLGYVVLGRGLVMLGWVRLGYVSFRLCYVGLG